ncbi:MAG: hypothetical protein LBB76_08180, partial [Azoarcus sp.]|nr:hypothetical protein [Azoarcus sp.]
MLGVLAESRRIVRSLEFTFSDRLQSPASDWPNERVNTHMALDIATKAQVVSDYQRAKGDTG